MPGKADPDRVGLRRDWEEAFGSPPPAYASVSFLRRALAHEAQVMRHGGLPAATRRALGQIATGRPVEEAARRRLRPGAHLVREWNGRSGAGRAEVLELVWRVDIAPETLNLAVDAHALAGREDFDPDCLDKTALTKSVPFQLRKRGVETKLVFADAPVGRDDTLIRNIARAHKWFGQIKVGRSFDEIAEEEGISRRRIRQMIDLAFLAPDIIRDVIDGKQPLGFTSDWCLRHQLPSEWSEQRTLRATL